MSRNLILSNNSKTLKFENKIKKKIKTKLMKKMKFEKFN